MRKVEREKDGERWRESSGRERAKGDVREIEGKGGGKREQKIIFFLIWKNPHFSPLELLGFYNTYLYTQCTTKVGKNTKPITTKSYKLSDWVGASSINTSGGW